MKGNLGKLVDMYSSGKQTVGAPTLRDVNQLSQSMQVALLNSIRVGPKVTPTGGNSPAPGPLSKGGSSPKIGALPGQTCPLCNGPIKPKTKVLAGVFLFVGFPTKFPTTFFLGEFSGRFFSTHKT